MGKEYLPQLLLRHAEITLINTEC